MVALITGMSTDTEAGWVSVASFTASSAANFQEKKNFPALLKFVRWKATLVTATAAMFSVRGMARNNYPLQSVRRRVSGPLRGDLELLPDFLKRRVGLWAGGGLRSGYAAPWLSPRRAALGAAVRLTLLAFGLSRRSGAIGTAGAPPAGDPGAPPADPAEPAAQPPPAAQGRPHAPAAPPSPQGREGVGDAARPAGVSPRPVPPAPTPSGTPRADELREGADLAEAIRARLDDDAFADRCPEVWVVLDATLEQLDPLVRDGDRELLGEFLPLARRSIDIAEACR